MIKRSFLAVVLLSILTAPAWGQDVPDWLQRTKISGLAFGGFYWRVADDAPDLAAENGFWLRRVYLTVDNNLNEQLAFRIRFEANSPGDFGTSKKLEPFVKDLYVRWKGGDQEVYLGLSSTPTWAVVEKVWGYRSVEKTPLDLQKFGSSRDFGVAAKGRIDRAGKVRYHGMVGNGTGTKSETNEGKMGCLSLGFHPGSGFMLELYGDYDMRPGATDHSTFQAFAAWQGERGRVGVQFARQSREFEGAETMKLEVASAFGVLKVSDRAAFLARYDRMFDPNPDGDQIAYIPFDPTAAKSNLVLVGLDLTVAGQLHLIPNVETVFYEGVGGVAAPDGYTMLRTTFSVTF